MAALKICGGEKHAIFGGCQTNTTGATKPNEILTQIKINNKIWMTTFSFFIDHS